MVSVFCQCRNGAWIHIYLFKSPSQSPQRHWCHFGAVEPKIWFLLYAVWSKFFRTNETRVKWRKSAGVDSLTSKSVSSFGINLVHRVLVWENKRKNQHNYVKMLTESGSMRKNVRIIFQKHGSENWPFLSQNLFEEAEPRVSDLISLKNLPSGLQMSFFPAIIRKGTNLMTLNETWFDYLTI